jgi:hypothetical protein
MVDYTVQDVRLVWRVHNHLIVKKKMMKGSLISLESHMRQRSLMSWLFSSDKLS